MPSTAAGLSEWPNVWGMTPRRRKALTRRLLNDLRLFAPFFVLVAETIVLALAIVAVERYAAPEPLPIDYLTSSSSTSNVSAAPPRMSGGLPLSP